MKREIKFRGKVRQTRPEIAIGKKPVDGTWVVGDLHYLFAGHPHIHFDFQAKISIDPDTISQYAGVKDKNGREIYEGDILRADYYPYHDDGVDNYLGVVFFSDDDYVWEVMKFVTAKSERRGISNFSNTEFYDTDFSKMEVVGNVWDSKGLFRDSDEKVLKWFNG